MNNGIKFCSEDKYGLSELAGEDGMVYATVTDHGIELKRKSFILYGSGFIRYFLTVRIRLAWDGAEYCFADFKASPPVMVWTVRRERNDHMVCIRRMIMKRRIIKITLMISFVF